MTVASRDEVILDSTKKILQIGQESPEQFSSLKKVILLEQTPRFDTKINADLSRQWNSKLKQLVSASPYNDRIVFGHLSLESYGIGNTFESRYCNCSSDRSDGIHLYGRYGSRDYTRSLANILSNTLKNETSSNSSLLNQGN